MLEEGSDQGEQGDRLDGGAGGGVEEIEEELLQEPVGLVFAGKRLRRVDERSCRFLGKRGSGRGDG